MKAYSTMVLGLTLAASIALSQGSFRQTTNDQQYLPAVQSYGNADLPQAKKGFLWALKSENNGVVESVLGHVTHMRITLSQEDMNDIEATVSQIARNGRTPAIRYKAYLASLVFVNPLTFCQAATGSYSDSDEFFGAIANRLQETLLGYGVQ